jgi:excisionase family DNA binding protein
LGRTGLVGVKLEPATEPPSPYLTTAEAAEYLRAKPQRVHDLLSAGRLTRFKEGGRTLVLRAELEALVKAERSRLESLSNRANDFATSVQRVKPPLRRRAGVHSRPDETKASSQ